jgi:hypothetical protein
VPPCIIYVPQHHLCWGGGWRPPDSILSWVCATLDGDSLSQGGCPLSRGAQAARIQARYRGRALRREQRQALEAESAARVQAAYRGVRTRKDVGSLRALRPAAIKVQVGVTHSAQHARETARPNGGRPNARTVPRGERQRLPHSLTPRACACMACGLWLRAAAVSGAAADARAWQASAPPEGGAARAARRPAHDRRRAAWQPRPPPCPGPSSVCPRLVILTPPSASGRHSLQRCIEAGPCS